MGKRFTQAGLDKLVAEGKIKGYFANAQPLAAKVKTSGVGVPRGLAHIKKVLGELGVKNIEEHRFHDVRMFRFDIALMEHKVAIEYEGLFSQKSRHTTRAGFTRDTTKYNLGVTEGWRVLRYTAKNYKEFEVDIKKLLEL